VALYVVKMALEAIHAIPTAGALCEKAARAEISGLESATDVVDGAARISLMAAQVIRFEACRL
jgi:hypothetical protein